MLLLLLKIIAYASNNHKLYKEYKENAIIIFMSEMTSLNIVELIEKTPIASLSNNYQNKLAIKIKNKFTNAQQQLFIASFYCYLTYNSTADFVVDLDYIWKWLEFSHKNKAKELLEKHFIKEIDYKNVLDAHIKQGRGGHNKETFMLTVNAFKRFCLKACTKKADQIHEYYIKLEETLHEIVNEESNELRLQVEEIKKTLTKTQETNKVTVDKLKKDITREKHNVFLREFANAGPLVYIIKVKTYENGEYVIKIGESRRGVAARYNEHKSKYEETHILDCFLVKRSKDFESFLHNHPDIRLNWVRNLPGHENENELFLIGKNLSYGVLENIIKTNINQFNDVDYQKLSDDIESIKNVVLKQHQQQILEDSNTIKQLLDNQNLILNLVKGLEKSNKEILERLNSMQSKTTTNFETPLPTVGPRLQKIHPETLHIIKVYETVTECMREDSKIKRPSLHNAIQGNTIYAGFRWMYIDRELDPITIINLQPTKQTKVQNLGYIAKLNQEKTQILNLYIDRKTAAAKNGYESCSALDAPVKNGTITNGYYYTLYEKCDTSLINDFIQNHGREPILYKDGVGQYDKDGQLVKEFTSRFDTVKKLHISDKTLTKALDKNIAYGGFYYRSIGSKIEC